MRTVQIKDPYTGSLMSVSVAAVQVNARRGQPGDRRYQVAVFRSGKEPELFRFDSATEAHQFAEQALVKFGSAVFAR